MIQLKRKGGSDRKEQTLKKAPLLILIIVILLFTACTGGVKNENTSPATPTWQGSPVIVYISPAGVIDTEPPAVETETGSTQITAPKTAELPAAELTPSSGPVMPGTEAPGQADTPSFAPTPEPTRKPSPSPTAEPTPEPTPKPTEKPIVKPNQTPTPVPTETPEPADPFSYIERAVSPVDFNGNGIDDYTDILIGARIDAENHPRYDGSYQKNGYPPDNIGVCADVIWRALKHAGYSLRYMVDKDIKDNSWRYPQIASGKEKRDNKIDFRRVRNLRIFFDEYAVKLTRDIYEIEEWQPGDIVIFNNNTHIGIVSDIRNERGVPYIIHNGGQADREQDYLEGDHKVAAHYRFDASRIPEEMLIPWEG